MDEWKTRPTLLKDWPAEVDYILAIDENGISDLKGVIEAKDDLLQWFTITGVLLNREEFSGFKTKITELKMEFWKDGLFKSKRVVFHSRDIRKKLGPFNPKLIDYDKFLKNLNSIIKEENYTIFSSSIDKFAHIRQYINPYPVYELCLEFILERYSFVLKEKGKKGLIVMESRGLKEDKKLLSTTIKLLDNGNCYHDSDDLKRIQGLYFNPKRTKNRKLSFPQLELADLISYYIYRSIKNESKTNDFVNIENKLYNFPHYKGYGVKVFPKKSNIF
ncbi:hypothetical protein ACQKMD_01100 [Viridibacillus sp. NPDC096237]|uniref:hypothetical protein n=1 Tax=Viridibacillus sp. NPDC096237 TaxID=3390721 RepID=UPI003CFCEC0B